MRDIKIVAYLQDVSEDDERLIETYLDGKGAITEGITIYTVDPLNELIKTQKKIIAEQLVRIEELEATDDD